MLVSLTIKQFALMEQVHLEFAAGMTVFTGETGAGKSMLVDALGAAFGARASADWVRHEAERAEIIAVWNGHSPRLDELLRDQDIEPEDEMILRRIITRDGRSRAYVNGIPVAVKLLQQLGDICLDLHGQHEHQALLRSEFQRFLLDSRLDQSLLDEVRDIHGQWREAGKRLQAIRSQRGETEGQAQWLRDELERLHMLSIEPGLAASLQEEAEAGRHHEQIRQAAAEALSLLDEAEPNARELVARAAHAVAAAETYYAGLSGSRDLLDQIDALISEAVPELRDVSELSFDEEGLRQAEERLARLHEAMRRHGKDEEGLLALMDDWQQRLASLDTAQWDEASLIRTLTQLAEQYRLAAQRLSDARRECAAALCRELRPFLDRLALPGMQVRFDIVSGEEESGWSVDGWDEIGISVMSNPGEPWRSLSAVASGGELSRMVLALKGCGALRKAPPIAVFDEVDTGVGGETAWCVGELLRAMGRERQVLVISHLPQVAASANAQVVISKGEKDGRTVTGLMAVRGEQRQQEIARMLGGGADTLGHAGRMLERGGEGC